MSRKPGIPGGSSWSVGVADPVPNAPTLANGTRSIA
jgi:hypothetical protein